MPGKLSHEKIDFELFLGKASAGQQRDPEAPFRLALLGDFSGRASRGMVEPAVGRQIRVVDCDNFEPACAQFQARLRLPLPGEAGQTFELPIAAMEDFHPDRLLGRVPGLAALLEKRKRLLNPSTAGEAATELQALLKQPPSPPAAEPAATTPTEADDATLARLLGGAPARPAQPATPHPATPLDRMIQNIVGPSAVPGTSPRDLALLSALDLELAGRLRAVLHHPQFQALEANWRGLDLLVRQFGAEENLKLHVVDLSREELLKDLRAEEDPQRTGLRKLLQVQADHEPLAVLIGLHTFDAEGEDLEGLARLAQIAAATQCPLLAGASPRLAGCDSFGQHPDPDDWTISMPAETAAVWQALRLLPESAWLGLALPRFLLRQPYGQESDPIEAFAFEELAAARAHESFLWGNPALLCGYLLAAAFQSDGWAMDTSGWGEVGDLPIYRYKEGDETQVKPCAEAWLSERAGERIMEKGLMPVLSIRGRDAVRLTALRSVRKPAAALAGRWG